MISIDALFINEEIFNMIHVYYFFFKHVGIGFRRFNHLDAFRKAFYPLRSLMLQLLSLP